MKNLLLIFSFLLLFTGVSRACSCGEFPAYCEEAILHTNFMGKVINHDYGYIDGEARVFYTNVLVLESLFGSNLPDTLSILNQDGLNCNASIFNQPVGDSVIISLPFDPINVEDWPAEIENAPEHITYDLFGCGIYHLLIDDGYVGGGYMELVKLENFLNDPVNNCPVLTNVDYPESSGVVEFSPNPVQETLNLLNKGEKSIINVYSLEGQLCLSLKLKADEAASIPVSHWPSGPYIVRQKARHGEQSTLLIKQ